MNKITYYDDYGIKHIVYGNDEFASHIRDRFRNVNVRKIMKYPYDKN